MRHTAHGLHPVARLAESRRAWQPIATLLVLWQETGACWALEQVILVTRDRLERRIAAVLRRRGIRDLNAVDDVMALVLDHVRRLSGAASAERSVTPFDPGRGWQGGGDSGLAYLLRLAKGRALDIARARHSKDGPVLSDLPVDVTVSAPGRTGLAHPLDLVREAACRLEPRQRTVIELLLQGRSQAAIAVLLEVSEGTVSRIRTRAIEQLRRQLAS